MDKPVAVVTSINGPVLHAVGEKTVLMNELVGIGEDRLVGEVIGINDDELTLQVFEETSGMRPGTAVFGTGAPLSVELGPGLLTGIFDGIQRPLPTAEAKYGSFIGRGMVIPSLDRDKKWHFSPNTKPENPIGPGFELGSVPETELIIHRVLMPEDISGKVTWLADEGDYTITDPIAKVMTDAGEVKVSMLRRWPVRQARPIMEQLSKNTPLVTGQRVLDSFFPIVKGGTSAIPGGFGTGKTVAQHQIAKWSDADIVIYIGCGERGNEITQVLQEFPNLIDPRNGHPLIERTVIIANTSNMQVAARDASIYTGITIAEYYRDMGYDVAVMADSTSRWAEAMREISGRLQEMPAQEGYPAYLSSRLAEFYERAGKVKTLGGREGSVSIIGAVSPPGGDFSEPVTQLTRQYTRVFWALDKNLASARHFPSINWLSSHSEYLSAVSDWWQKETGFDWRSLRAKAMEILTEEDHLNQIVRLVGPDVLPDGQRLILLTAELLTTGFLQQNALDEIDTYSSPQKQIRMLNTILHFYEQAEKIIKRGAVIQAFNDLPIIHSLLTMKNQIHNDQIEKFDSLILEMDHQLASVEEKYV